MKNTFETSPDIKLITAVPLWDVTSSRLTSLGCIIRLVAGNILYSCNNWKHVMQLDTSSSIIKLNVKYMFEYFYECNKCV